MRKRSDAARRKTRHGETLRNAGTRRKRSAADRKRRHAVGKMRRTSTAGKKRNARDKRKKRTAEKRLAGGRDHRSGAFGSPPGCCFCSCAWARAAICCGRGTIYWIRQALP